MFCARILDRKWTRRNGKVGRQELGSIEGKGTGMLRGLSDIGLKQGISLID
jgi:hypothetical protein